MRLGEEMGWEVLSIQSVPLGETYVWLRVSWEADTWAQCLLCPPLSVWP